MPRGSTDHLHWMIEPTMAPCPTTSCHSYQTWICHCSTDTAFTLNNHQRGTPSRYIYPYYYAFRMMSTHILVPLGVDLNTRAEFVARLFAGLILGRPSHVMHVMCGITRTAWVWTLIPMTHWTKQTLHGYVQTAIHQTTHPSWTRTSTHAQQFLPTKLYWLWQ